MGSQEADASGFEQDQKRRASAYVIGTQAEDELQKAKQGASSNEVLDSMVKGFEEADVSQSQSTLVYNEDGSAMKKVSHLTVMQVSSLRDRSSKKVNHHLLASKIKEHFAAYSGHQNRFAFIGRTLGNVLRRPPTFQHIRPCLDLKIDPKLRPKKTYNRTQHKKTEAQVIRGKNVQQIREEGGEDRTIMDELNIVHRHLKDAWKNKEKGGEAPAVDYYRFVINPTDFAETVENMFYVSFLVKDGYVKLYINPTTGLPSLVKLPAELRREYQHNKNQHEAKQTISTIDYGTYQRLIAKLKITEPSIKWDATTA